MRVAFRCPRPLLIRSRKKGKPIAKFYAAQNSQIDTLLKTPIYAICRRRPGGE